MRNLKSVVIKRSIILDGHKTSVSLENEFWEGLREIVSAKKMTVSDLVGQIDRERDNCNLSSAIRVFVSIIFVCATAIRASIRATIRAAI